ncbi:hypothetical protein KYU16_000725 [Listeria monocytogenes]|nr:hypothetical protein [Listeria monocytogenes]
MKKQTKQAIWLALAVIAINGLATFFYNIVAASIAIIVTIACFVALLKIRR